MSPRRSRRCFEYVNRPFAIVERALATDPIPLLVGGTASEATDPGTEVHLRVDLGPIEIGAGVTVEVKSWAKRIDPLAPRSTFELTWRATRASRAFPELRAELAIYPLSATETQLDLTFDYQPPLGLVGEAIDALAMHHVAEASFERFLRDVAAHLRQVLPEPTRAVVKAATG
jgi:hypothetical protein